MSTALQSKLLRFMQNGEIRRIGGHEVRHVAVRVVAASNKKIDDEVRKDRFRLDLLYRFIVRLRVPSLREHKEDIPLLIDSLLARFGYAGVRLSSEAVETLMLYDWPGNVRELENVLQQTLLLSPFSVILQEHLPERFRHPEPSGNAGAKTEMTPLEAAQRDQILRTLIATGWNQTRTAEVLGIDRKTLRLKIRRWDLYKDRPEDDKPESPPGKER